MPAIYTNASLKGRKFVQGKEKMIPFISQNRSLQELITEKAFKRYGRSLPSEQIRGQLEELKIADFFERTSYNAALANSVLSGIWLLHGFLDESHSLSQDLHTPEGSFWHAIMHRLEGDFWNSKYWYRQVGRHPVDQMIQSRLKATDLKLMGGSWSPSRFVDLCQSESSGQSSQGGDDSQGLSDRIDSAVHRIAVIEWKSLFEYCWSAV